MFFDLLGSKFGFLRETAEIDVWAFFFYRPQG
jgi:hypothetical protein